MIKRFTSIFALLAAAAAALFCINPAPAGDAPQTGEYVTSYSKTGKVLVMIIDRSQSMKSNDAERFNIEGASLAAAISNKGDNLGIVRFSTEADVFIPMRTLSTVDDRTFAISQIQKIQPEGTTNFVLALIKAREMLAAVKAPAGSSVVFFTDGQPEGEYTDRSSGKPVKKSQEEAIMGEIKNFADADWRIYTIGFSPGVNASLLSDMAVKTGGAFFKVNEPQDLIKSFITVTSNVYNFMKLTGDVKKQITEPLQIVPGTNRLVYILTKHTKESGATISKLLRNDTELPIPGADVFRYPQGTDPSYFEVTHVFDPTKGDTNAVTFKAVLAGTPLDAYILNEPPFSIQIMAEHPREEYIEGETISCGLEIKSSIPAALATLRDKAVFEASFFNSASNKLAAKIELNTKEISGDALRCSGETKLTRSGGAVKEPYTIVFSLKYDKWLQEKSITINLLPEPGTVISAYPPEIKIEPVWADDAKFSKQLRLETVFPEKYSLQLSAEGGFFKVTPESAIVTNTEGAILTVSELAGATLSPGRVEGAVVLSGASSDGKTKIAGKKVGVSATFAALSPEGVIDLGAVSRAQKVALPLPISIEPNNLKFNVSISEAVAVGPKDKLPYVIKLSTSADEKGALVVNFTVPTDAPLGKYMAHATITPAASTLTPRMREITFEVGAPAPRLAVTPAELNIASKRVQNGWEEGELKLKLDFYGPWAVKTALSPLVSENGVVIDNAYDLRLTPKEWDPSKPLEPGKEATLVCGVYVYSDLAPGRYKGEITLEMADPDETRKEPLIVRVPVTFELNR
jgi:Mg-chelatase subunit ChlD